MPQPKELERSITKIKLDLSRISEERWRASVSRNQNEVVRAWMNAAEKTLENCGALGEYVANFSAPMARQINAREAEARRTFQEIKRRQDPKLFHNWIKEQLIPSTRFAERLAHVAASARNSQQTMEGFHRWNGK